MQTTNDNIIPFSTAQNRHIRLSRHPVSLESANRAARRLGTSADEITRAVRAYKEEGGE